MEIIFTKKSKIRCLEYQMVKKLFQQRRFLLILFLFLAFFTDVSAQTNVSGTVKDRVGNALVGTITLFQERVRKIYFDIKFRIRRKVKIAYF